VQAVKANNRWLIYASFVVGLMTSVFSLSGDLVWLRPQIVALIFIYWALVCPHLVGIFTAWLLGLMLDILAYTHLGQHSLAMVIVAYICLQSYQRIRRYSAWQQAGWVFVMIGIHQLFVNWVHSLTGHSAHPSQFLLPALSSALLWPAVYVLLERLRIRYRLA
jgi:rod shape-determining protein MreD